MTLSIEIGLPTISGDAKHLERDLTSLVENAIKFSPDGEDMNISLKPDEEKVIIIVSNNDVGITEKDLYQLFGRLYHKDNSNSGKNIFGGLGLGLATTRQVISQHF